MADGDGDIFVGDNGKLLYVKRLRCLVILED
jgi:hypothetical protein